MSWSSSVCHKSCDTGLCLRGDTAEIDAAESDHAKGPLDS